MKATREVSIECTPVIEQPRNHLLEITIRLIGITVVSAISVFFDFGYSQEGTGFLKVFLISFLRTALIWNGSMYIIQYAMSRYSLFKETAKLILFQVAGLSIFVVMVELGEIYSVENFLGITMTHSTKTSLIVGSLLITFMISSIYASVAFFIQW